MKNLIVLLTAMMMTVTASAKTSQETEQLAKALQLLGDVAEVSRHYEVTPNKDIVAMVKELALSLDNDEEDLRFDPKDNSYAWEIDSGAWGLSDFNEAQAYVLEGIADVVEYHKELGEDVTGLQAKMTANAKQAFTVLKKMKSVQYGIGPVGGVQCGATFPAILIMDTETGKIMSISMDGNGC